MARRDGRNTTRYWCDARLPGVSLLRAELATYQFAPHVHDTYVIAVTEAGGASIKCRGRTHDVLPATIFLSNPMEPQAATIRRSDRWQYRAIYLSDRAATSIAHALGLDRFPSFTTPFCVDEELTGAILALHQSLEAPPHDHPDVVQTRALETIGTLIAHYGTTQGADVPKGDEAVRRAIAVIRDRYADRLRLEDLSDPIGVSPFQLIALFKRTVGLTPYTYLTQVRLREARRYLLAGHPIAYAAVAVGFYDQSAFTRHFKRSYGITPLQFAAAARVSAL